MGARNSLSVLALHRFEFFLAQLNFSIFGAGKYEEANFKYTALNTCKGSEAERWTI